MAAPPTAVSKLKGTLHLGATGAGGVDAEAQVSAIGTPQTVTRDSPLTVLTGDVVQAGATYSWSLVGTMILDWTVPTGVFYWVHTNQGTTQPFTFTPVGATGPTFSGQLVVDGWNLEELNSGAMVVSKFTWPIQGQLTITPPGGLLADDATPDAAGEYVQTDAAGVEAA
jgi:hypothetical protein